MVSMLKCLVSLTVTLTTIFNIVIGRIYTMTENEERVMDGAYVEMSPFVILFTKPGAGEIVSKVADGLPKELNEYTDGTDVTHVL